MFYDKKTSENRTFFLCNYFFIVRYILNPIEAMKIDIKGLIKLKKQYGIYVIVATPNTLDCAIAHVFHGTSTDVTVAESSIVRLNKRDSKPCFW